MLGNCSFWSSAISFDDAPDEKDHYDLLAFVARQGRLPRYGEESFTVYLLDVSNRERVYLRADAADVRPWPRSRYEIHHTYLFSAQLPYAMGGWFMRVLGGPSVAKARLWSALCIALAAAATCLAARLLWPQRPGFAALAGLVFGLWPQVTFVGAYVNDDAFAILAASAVLLACVRVDVAGLTPRRAVLLGLALGLLGSAKYYVFAFVPLVIVWAGLYLRRHGRSAARLLVLSALVASMLAAVWPIRNTVLYGDPLGRRFFNQEARSFIDDLPSAVAERTPRRLAETSLHATGDPVTRLFERGWIRHSLQSFWGWFGWMKVRMSPLAYATALFVVGGFLTASIAGEIRKRRRSEWRRASPLPGALRAAIPCASRCLLARELLFRGLPTAGALPARLCSSARNADRATARGLAPDRGARGGRAPAHILRRAEPDRPSRNLAVIDS